jgi:hypothetical protein
MRYKRAVGNISFYSKKRCLLRLITKSQGQLSKVKLRSLLFFQKTIFFLFDQIKFGQIKYTQG